MSEPVVVSISLRRALCCLLSLASMACGARSSLESFAPPTEPGAAGAGGAGGGSAGSHAATCKELHERSPELPSGVYVLEPPGSASPFSVRCDMKNAGGGFTLVGAELPGEPAVGEPNGCGWSNYSAGNGKLRFLDVDSNNPEPLAKGAESGLLGRRFRGLYREVWIQWDTSRFIRFSLAGVDLFGGDSSTSIPILDFATSEPDLDAWVQQDGGAIFCAAARSPDVLPGDTSWAIKPKGDSFNECGCNSGGWTGHGAYYGGTTFSQQTVCCGWGGGFAGVKDSGVQKGGITPTSETQIWIR